MHCPNSKPCCIRELSSSFSARGGGSVSYTGANQIWTRISSKQRRLWLWCWGGSLLNAWKWCMLFPLTIPWYQRWGCTSDCTPTWSLWVQLLIDIDPPWYSSSKYRWLSPDARLARSNKLTVKLTTICSWGCSSLCYALFLCKYICIWVVDNGSRGVCIREMIDTLSWGICIPDIEAHMFVEQCERNCTLYWCLFQKG